MIQLKRSSTDSWNSSNEILESGQIGIEIRDSEADRFKIGDGSSTWQTLQYSTPDPAIYKDTEIASSTLPLQNINTNKVTIGSLALVYDSSSNSINVESTEATS